MKPTVGRIVHYVSRGSADGVFPSICRAAVVAAIYEGTQAADLCVLNPMGIFFALTVPQDEDNHIAGSWHWPEREQ